MRTFRARSWLAIETWRPLWLMSVLWGASVFWLSPWPIGTDMPQHAGQIALLRDWVQGGGPWSHIVRLNPFTPYLIGYSLALPLSLVLPIPTALKLLLSLSYVGYVGLAVLLRKRLGGDPRLDWLLLLGFFGIAYKWGFFTFLVATPVLLMFLLCGHRYARMPTVSVGLTVTGVGLVLLLSHGLAFMLGASIGGAMYLMRGRLNARSVARGWPYCVLAVALVCYFMISRQNEAGIASFEQSPLTWGWSLERVPKALVYSIGAEQHPLFYAVALLAPLVPWLLGLKPNLRDPIRWAPFLVTLAFMLFAPYYAVRTGIFPPRFAILLLPAYLWLFTASDAPSPARRHHNLVLAGTCCMCWALLSYHSVQNWRFGRESADFHEMMAHLSPSQRALSLTLDAGSSALGFRDAYRHQALWYQAEAGGFVDPNFAWFPPQMVRFLPGRTPAVRVGLEADPQAFRWNVHRGKDYRYILVRHRQPVPQELFAGATCSIRLVAHEGTWSAFENVNCR